MRTGAQQAQQDSSSITGFLNFLKTFLLVFAGVALFVGSFVIANSLSITIAQRTREFATLRTLGASRKQVRRSILVESFVIGAIASVIGLAVGLGLAQGLFALFNAAGVTLPNTGTVVKPRTIIVAILVGVIVTVLASLRPAIRATRVEPIAAVREGATIPEGRLARYRTVISGATAVVGLVALLLGLFVASGTGGRAHPHGPRRRPHLHRGRRCCRRGSFRGWRRGWAGRPPGSPARSASWPATTPSATLSAPHPRRRR